MFILLCMKFTIFFAGLLLLLALRLHATGPKNTDGTVLKLESIGAPKTTVYDGDKDTLIVWRVAGFGED